jgi:Mce-associated membrane protein
MSSEDARASRAEADDEVEDRTSGTGPAADDADRAGGADGVAADRGERSSEEDGTDAVEGGKESKLREPRRLVLAAGAFSLAALIASGIFGAMWWVASADDNADRAAAREDVVRVGSSALQAFTELDYNHPDEYFDRAVSVSTKEIGDQINAGRDANKKTMTDSKTTTNTRVMDIAVEELNTDEGKASFLAAIQVDLKQGDKSTVKPMRVEIQMTKQGSDWKLSGIDPVPVVSS